MINRRKVIGYPIAGIGFLVLALIAGWWQVDGPGADLSKSTQALNLKSMSFSLTNHKGQSVGPEALVGRASMVFFGFTHCPDICPTTLSDISGWIEAMEEEESQLNIIFITIDPERDKVETMAEYVSHFHPSIRGWTGSEDQIAQAAKSFRVKYEKVMIDGDDYSMDHTASVFLFDKDGNSAGIIDLHESREMALPKIRRAL